MSGYGNETMPRGAADLRSQKGHRLLFDKTTEAGLAQWYTARLLKRLTPENLWLVRTLAECCLGEQLNEIAEKGGTR